MAGDVASKRVRETNGSPIPGMKYEHSPRPSTGPPGFEGPEKKFEIDFRLKVGLPDGLLLVNDAQWQQMLDLAHCTIVSKKESEFCRMYILSESSLFVYRRKIVLKTCGTTTLLRVLPHLLQLVSNEKNTVNADLVKPLGLEVEYMMYCRKNFLWPERQEKPHRSFYEEVAFLEQHFEGGGGYVLGPLNGEHWNFFVADYTDAEAEETNPTDQTFEIIMSDLSDAAMSHFFKKDGKDADGVTVQSGISSIFEGSMVDARLFDPCGYSMNGLVPGGKHYWTIHITPEKECSFVSFETNLPKESYQDTVARVLQVFEPGQAVVTLFADNLALGGRSARDALPAEIPGFRLRYRTAYDFERPYNLTVLHFSRVDPSTPEAKRACLADIKPNS